MGQISDLITLSHETAQSKKFWDALKEFRSEGQEKFDDEVYVSVLSQMYGNRLMHVVRELGEAWEEFRVNGHTKDFDEELADSAIVLFDLCGAMGVDLEKSILKKMKKNEDRPDKHGKRF